ncbi:hypothetical protein MNBD_NITROSPINAE04-396 [hydrothermal vent metagenome]|uniref:DUF362 domain-containing protein n=1 Tax=hydrothermal vent metagenome TaxID=652676 RepID=A0A3B1C4S3_9ZZZZ
MANQVLQSNSVALAHVDGYDLAILADTLDKAFTSISFKVPSQARVLVKPNWIAVKNARLSCTRPQFIRAVCQYFLDRGAKVTVGDSPAFGSALKVARKSGAVEALAGLDIPIIDFKSGPRLDLSFGKSVKLARQPAAADLIVNLPKLKAHGQLGITAGVKNFFGCVVGIKKALIHSKYGDVKNHFESVVTEVMQALQPSVTILDGIEAMSESGPIDGEPVRMNIVAVSENPVALDTAIYSLLEMSPSSAPLWREAKARHLPGADLEEIDFPLEKLDQFKAHGFMPPASLAPLTFSPPRIALGALKRLWRRIA